MRTPVAKGAGLGLGLIEIGRPWGTDPFGIPDEGAVRELLQHAVELNICFFDTAPAYGLSEQRLGQFLSTLTAAERQKIIISTKFGERWNSAIEQPYIDHTYEGLCRTVDESLAQLGRVDVLQVHKASAAVLGSEDLRRGIEYAKSCGIETFGASISDFEAATVACRNSNFSYLQFPFNLARNSMLPVFAQVEIHGLMPIVNRPTNMGQLLGGVHAADDRAMKLVEAYAYIAEHCARGVVLAGTKSKAHLDENVDAFRIALDQRDLHIG